MDKLTAYAIPIRGLKNGEHSFVFKVEKDFFEAFENTEFENPAFDVKLLLDKHDSFFELFFDINGTVGTMCDKCTASINLPIVCKDTLKVKYTEQNVVEDADIVFISPDTTIFNVAQYIFEFIVLAIPIYRTYDCQSQEVKPCDFAALKTLEALVVDEDAKAKEAESSNVFSQLKNIFSQN